MIHSMTLDLSDQKGRLLSYPWKIVLGLIGRGGTAGTR